MRRSTSALRSSAIAIALVALVYGIGSDRWVSNTTDSRRGDSDQAQPTAAPGAQLDHSTTVAPQRSDANNTEDLVVAEVASESNAEEEAETHRFIRETATSYVHQIYPLLIRDFDLTANQQDALLELLIESVIAHSKSAFTSGQDMDEHERTSRIAAIIGETKLQQLLAREQNREEYAEIHRVQSMLQSRGVPLTDSQRVGLLDILVEVRKQIDYQLPADMDRKSFETFQYKIDRMDDYERLVLELTPSLLSSKQVEYVFERYQALSEKRVLSLELQRRLVAGDDPRFQLFRDNGPAYPSRDPDSL